MFPLVTGSLAVRVHLCLDLFSFIIILFFSLHFCCAKRSRSFSYCINLRDSNSERHDLSYRRKLLETTAYRRTGLLSFYIGLSSTACSVDFNLEVVNISHSYLFRFGVI